MNDPKSTNDIRLISLDVVRQQAEVCAARRDRMSRQSDVLTEQVKANATAIAALATSVATMAVTVTPLQASIKEHGEDIRKLKGRPAVWAAIGAALPTLLGVLLWWFGK